MSLAERLRSIRAAKGLSLDELASSASISKTYLWELERDLGGVKKPSADVLLKIANVLHVTIGDLLELPTVRVDDRTIEIAPSLEAFRLRMARLGTPLSATDLRDLALTNFRGNQPNTVDEWHQLYLALESTSGKNRTR
jgi:transcriptional regulator with XRE-family HTH domain